MKKFYSIIITIAFLITSVFFTNAYATDIETLSLDTSFVVGVYNYSQVPSTSGETYFIGSRKVGRFTYEVNRYYGDWYALLNLDLSTPCFKGSSAMELTQTIGRTYSAQLAYEFSHAVGGTVNAEIFEITSSITNSVAVTFQVSFEMANSVSYQLDDTKPVGYYKIGVCHDLYRHSVRQYIESAEYASLTDTGVYYEMPTPEGIAYYALLYSTSSGSGYKKY